jgi:hypothetical protein
MARCQNRASFNNTHQSINFRLQEFWASFKASAKSTTIRKVTLNIYKHCNPIHFVWCIIVALCQSTLIERCLHRSLLLATSDLIILSFQSGLRGQRGETSRESRQVSPRRGFARIDAPSKIMKAGRKPCGVITHFQGEPRSLTLAGWKINSYRQITWQADIIRHK